MAFEMKGVDVSEYQLDVDFKKVKQAGYDFVMIRSGFGRKTSQRDINIYTNTAKVLEAGLHFGYYHYSYADTVEKAIQEANFVLSLIKDYKPDMPIAYDLEDASLKSVDKATMSKIADAFCTKIKEAGYYPIIYASLSWRKTRFEEWIFDKRDFWLAQWSEVRNTDYKCTMWQNTQAGRVDGIHGYVDTDICYKDYPSIINGKTKNEHWAQKHYDALVKAHVINGDETSKVWQNFDGSMSNVTIGEFLAILTKLKGLEV